MLNQTSTLHANYATPQMKRKMENSNIALALFKTKSRSIPSVVKMDNICLRNDGVVSRSFQTSRNGHTSRFHGDEAETKHLSPSFENILIKIGTGILAAQTNVS